MTSAPVQAPLGASLRPDADALGEFWDRSTVPGQTYEVRVPKTRKKGPCRFWGTVSGYFNRRDAFVESVSRITGLDAESVYVTLSPVKPELRARADNHLKDHVASTTADDDIPRRRRFLIDVDPVRPAGIAATDAEVVAALQARDTIESYLTDLGWPAPLYRMMSGSGGGLVYVIDEPNDAASETLISRGLAALGEMFDGDTVTVDQTVSNAARITKIPGTVGANGDHTPDLGRVWRLATAEYAAGGLVTTAILSSLAALASAAEDKKAVGFDNPSNGQRTWAVADVLKAAGVGFETVKRKWGTLYKLDRCLTSDAHMDGAAILERANGRLGYRCHHDHCEGKHWADVRGKLGLRERANGHKSVAGGRVPKSAEDKDTVGLIKRLADAISESAHFARDAAGRLYVFQDGVYRPNGEGYVKRTVKALLEQ